MKFINYLFLLGFLVLTSCVKEEYDTPPIGGVDPDLEVTHTIKELKEMHVFDSFEKIEDDIIISGIVISDDRAGNFFRVLYLQDETAGIEIRIDETDLHNLYPVGRRVFVKCRNLWLGDFANVTQLGLDLDIEVDPQTGAQEINGIARIPGVLLDDFLFPGSIGNTVVAKEMTISEINNLAPQELLIDHVSSLVTVTDVEFGLGDLCLTYADAVNNTSANRDLLDCSSQELLLRSSGFASFAGDAIPAGNGSITGILGVFVDDIQLLIRNTDDVNMNGERCAQDMISCNAPAGPISALRAAFENGDTVPELILTGIVSSDFIGGNINSQNLFLEDENGDGAIAVRFSGDHTYEEGARLEIESCGLEFNEFNGLLQITGLSCLNVRNIGESEVTPRIATIEDILANGENWESGLVQIENATINGGLTFSGEKTISDGTGEILLFTFSSASFANDLVPSGEVTVIGNLSQFNNDYQIVMRNGDDVIGGDIGGDGERLMIGDLRNAFNNGATVVDNGFVEGTVISDRSFNNTVDQNLVVQDETGGIVLRFNDSHGIAVGSVVKCFVSGIEYSEFNGLLQISGLPNVLVEVISTGDMPEPRATTIAELKTNLEIWESTLVSLEDVSFSGGPTYGESVNIDDGTGSMQLYTRPASSFSGDNIPATEKKVVGILGQFNNIQLSVRNLDDITD